MPEESGKKSYPMIPLFIEVGFVLIEKKVCGQQK